MKIKHKLASRPSWSRIIEKDYKCTYVDIPEFKGYVTELFVDEVELLTPKDQPVQRPSSYREEVPF